MARDSIRHIELRGDFVERIRDTNVVIYSNGLTNAKMCEFVYVTCMK